MNYEAAVNELIEGAAKPPNSLGLLEKYFRKVLLAWETMHDELRPHHVVFAADNGVVEEGIAAFPSSITYLQGKNMVAGGATISCFCKSNAIPYSVVDVGVDNESAVGLNRKVARGTKNFMKTEAMTKVEFEEAWRAGEETAAELIGGQGVNLLSFGEMGIGNTTTSAAVLHALTGMFPEFLVGYGASPVNNDLLKRKRLVVGNGVARHKAAMQTVPDILRCVGGFDIVAICAGMSACARLKTPFVIDGFITAVAYACAARLNSDIEKYAIPSHISKEPGMAYALLLGNILADDVIIRGNMALGEGTGAVLMVSILKSTAFAFFHMARLADFAAGDTDDKSPQVAI